MMCAPSESVIEEIIFLGTGSSCCVPRLSCFIQPQVDPCAVCSDARDNPESRNRRLNTSCIIRVRQADDNSLKTIMIDCGRVF